MNSEDRIRGMVLGGALGDALGAPHEFRDNRVDNYTGVLQHRLHLRTQYNERWGDIGQYTDDTEMSIALGRSLISRNGYDHETVTMNYMVWANDLAWDKVMRKAFTDEGKTVTPCMGRNTRKLLYGHRTYVTFLRKWHDAHDGMPEQELSQSNGCLMRASPLAVLNNVTAVEMDCRTTNPSPVTVDTCRVYYYLLRSVLLGYDAKSAMTFAEAQVRTPEVASVFLEVRSDVLRNLASNKGHCLHGLYCTLVCLDTGASYEMCMDWIIRMHPGSDTDTNAAIAGCVLGALRGYSGLINNPMTSSNASLLLTRNMLNGPNPRPPVYGLNDFDSYCGGLARLLEASL